jgi:hypothetical protein
MTRPPSNRIAATTRRDILRATTATGLFLFTDSLIFAASDFWTKKPAAEWSSDEIKLLRTKSPWAKKVRGEMAGTGLSAPPMDAPAGGGRSPSINAGGLPGRGMVGGDDTPGGAARGGPQAPEVVIRWESAQPLLAATKAQLPAELLDRYTISVTGLPPQMILLGLPRPAGRGRGDTPPQPAQDPAARQKAEVDTILSETTLTVKGRDPQAADAMLRTADAQTFLFGFPKQNLPLTASDKEVVFTMKLGILTIRAKFEPKEMMFDGQLAV